MFSYDSWLDYGNPFTEDRCTGYAFTCDCEECEHARKLYDEHDWLSDDKEFNKERLEEIEKELEDMGYSM